MSILALPTGSACASCPIGERCSRPVPALVRDGSTTLVVGSHGTKDALAARVPIAGGSANWLQSVAKRSGVNWRSLSLANVVPCAPPSEAFPTSRDCPVDTPTARAAVSHCVDSYLLETLRARPWQRIIALGDEALFYLTGRSGIWSWRGSPLALRPDLVERTGLPSTPLVIPVLHPDVLGKNMRWYDTVRRDFGRTLQLPPENYVLYANRAHLRPLSPRRVVVDFEWLDIATGTPVDHVTLCGISDGPGRAFVANGADAAAMAEMKRIVENADEVCAHNLFGAEEPWWKRLGWAPRGKLYDTMLGQALVQPDMPHDLGYVASYFAQAVHWKGRGDEKEDTETGEVRGGAQWRTWNAPDAIPREHGGYGGCKTPDEAHRLYNARDCAYNYAIWDAVFQVVSHYGMDQVYRSVSIPSSRMAYEMSERGWPIEPNYIAEFRQETEAKIADLETKLPPALAPCWVDKNRQIPAPPGTYKFKEVKCRGLKKNGTQHDEITWLFVQPGERPCPVCGKTLASGKLHEYKVLTETYQVLDRPWQSPAKILTYAKECGVKMREHPKTGNITADKAARAIWARKHPEFRTINEVMKLQKQLIAFAKDEWVGLTRLYYRFNPIGAASGRWSASGGGRSDGLNIQQMPAELRRMFVPTAPGHGILQFDFAAAEPNLTAFLANDTDRLARLATPGYSEHADVATRFFEFEVRKGDKETEDEYKVGKIVNNGMSYGMGVGMLQDKMEVVGMYVSRPEVAEFKQVWRDLNKGTARWQDETIARASADGRLTNPFGRSRWFQNSASVATEALAFGPSSTLADIMLRAMMALQPDRFADELADLGVAVQRALPPGWTIMIQVHDSIVLDGPHETYVEAARAVYDVMTQPWAELNGFSLGVDIEYSRKSWGHCKTHNEWAGFDTPAPDDVP